VNYLKENVVESTGWKAGSRIASILLISGLTS